MPPDPPVEQSVEAVDHVAEARRLIAYGTREGADESLPVQYAQAHAQIAIAEALEDIRHELEELNVRLNG